MLYERELRDVLGNKRTLAGEYNREYIVYQEINSVLILCPIYIVLQKAIFFDKNSLKKVVLLCVLKRKEGYGVFW